MGLETDRELLKDKSIPCHGWKYDGRYLLFKKGMIGPMRDDQELKFCDMSIAEIEPLPPRLAKRFEIMRGLEEKYPYCLDIDVHKSIISSLKADNKTGEAKIIERFPICSK